MSDKVYAQIQLNGDDQIGNVTSGITYKVNGITEREPYLYREGGHIYMYIGVEKGRAVPLRAKNADDATNATNASKASSLLVKSNKSDLTTTYIVPTYNGTGASCIQLVQGDEYTKTAEERPNRNIQQFNFGIHGFAGKNRDNSEILDKHTGLTNNDVYTYINDFNIHMPSLGHLWGRGSGFHIGNVRSLNLNTTESGRMVGTVAERDRWYNNDNPPLEGQIFFVIAD